MSDWNSWKTVKVRKEHKCNGCRTMIEKGEQAAKGSGVHEGDFYSVYLCMPCDEYLKNNDDFEDGWYDGDIGEARRMLERENTA